MSIFGSKEEPSVNNSSFDPIVTVDVETTFDELRPKLETSLRSGLEYWQTLGRVTKGSLETAQNIDLYEKGLRFLNGESTNSSGLVEVVSQMEAVAINQAESQFTKRIDECYDWNNKVHNPVWLGRLVWGKLGVVWNLGGRSIDKYKQDVISNAIKVGNFITNKTQSSNTK
jgi:hypothetical protein